MLFNESRIRLLLPQISTFLKSWIPSVPVPSYEMSALVYYVGLIVETSFHLDRSVLSLFDCFMQLPRESLVKLVPQLSSSLLRVVTNVADDLRDDREMWKCLESIIDSLIMSSEHTNEDVLKTIDFIFNNYEVNKFIPNDFTSTLCLLINNLYLRNDALNDSKTPKGEEVFSCYISVINYCYVIYNNIWSAYEAKMAKNQFGTVFPLISHRLQQVRAAVSGPRGHVDL